MGAPEGVNVYVKLESENPGGSIKDRLAYGVIEFAEKVGFSRDKKGGSHS
jgi:cysteine synthase A